MSKIFSIIDDLHLCYQSQAPLVEDYAKLTSTDRAQLCLGVRKSLVDYVNSPEYTFKDIANNLLQEYKSKIKFNY